MRNSIPDLSASPYSLGRPMEDCYQGSGGGKERTNGHVAKQGLFKHLAPVYHDAKNAEGSTKQKNWIASVVFDHLFFVQERQFILWDSKTKTPHMGQGNDTRKLAYVIIKQGLRDAIKSKFSCDRSGNPIISPEELKRSKKFLEQCSSEVAEKDLLNSVQNVSLGSAKKKGTAKKKRGAAKKKMGASKKLELASAIITVKDALSGESEGGRRVGKRAKGSHFTPVGDPTKEVNAFEPVRGHKGFFDGQLFIPVPSPRTSPDTSPNGSPTEFGSPFKNDDDDDNDNEVWQINNNFRPVVCSPEEEIEKEIMSEVMGEGRKLRFETPLLTNQSLDTDNPKKVTPSPSLSNFRVDGGKLSLRELSPFSLGPPGSTSEYRSGFSLGLEEGEGHAFCKHPMTQLPANYNIGLHDESSSTDDILALEQPYGVQYSSVAGDVDNLLD